MSKSSAIIVVVGVAAFGIFVCAVWVANQLLALPSAIASLL